MTDTPFTGERQRRYEQFEAERREIAKEALLGGVRRAIIHLKEVSAGVVQPDAHTDQLVELGLELSAEIGRIRDSQTKEPR